MKRIERIITAISVSVGLLLGYVLMHTASQFLFMFFAGGSQEEAFSVYQRHKADVYLVTSLLFAAFVIFLLIFYGRKRQSDFAVFLLPPAKTIPVVFPVSAFLAGVCLNFAFTNLIQMMPMPQQWVADNAESVGAFSQSALWVMVLAQSFAAPLAEELLFRGVMYRALRQAPLLANRRLCICVSATVVSLVFGWIHGNTLQMLYCFCFSLILILIVERTDSLWGAVLAHMGFNSPWILLLLIHRIYDAKAYLGNTVIFGVLAAGLVLLTVWAGDGLGKCRIRVK